MTNEKHDSLDEAFDSLRSHGANLGDAFSQSLEDRLMLVQEGQTKKSARSRRYLVYLAIAALAILGGGVASYAATDGWNFWPWTITVDSNGTVTDEKGDRIGTSVDNADGTSTTTVQLGQGYVEIQANESLKGKQLRTVVAP